MGIEPTSSAWKAEVLPLNYTRRCAPHPTDLRPVPLVLASTSASYGGGGRIRTFEGVSRQIYSLLPLAAWVPLRENEPRILISEAQGVNASWRVNCWVQRPAKRGASLERGRFLVWPRNWRAGAPGRGLYRARTKSCVNARDSRPARPPPHDPGGRDRQPWAGGGGIRREWPVRAWPKPRE